MIEMYKILTDKYDESAVPKMQLSTSSETRGNFLKLATLRPNYDTCKYSFTVRVNSSQMSGKRPVNSSQNNGCDELTVSRYGIIIMSHLACRKPKLQEQVTKYVYC